MSRFAMPRLPRVMLLLALLMGLVFTSPFVHAEDKSPNPAGGSRSEEGSAPGDPPPRSPAVVTPLSDQGGSTSNTLLPFEYWRYPGVDSQQVLRKAGGSKGITATVKIIWNGIKELLGPVLVFLIAGLGIQLLLARGNEEAMSKAMNQLLYILVGTAIVIFADQVSSLFSLYQEYRGVGRTATTFISGQEELNATGSAFTEMIMIIIRFVRYLLGGIAVFYVIKSGLAILMSTEDETVTKQKEVFIYGFVGFLFVLVAEGLVNVVFDVNTLELTYGEKFRVDVNVSGGIRLLMNVANVLLAAMSGLFLFSLVAGGALYAFSAGNEERGKKATTLIIASLTGLVIAFSSYTIVAEFTSAGRSAQLREVQNEVEPLSIPAPNL